MRLRADVNLIDLPSNKVKPSNPFDTRGANDRFVRRCRMEGNKVKPLNPGALDKV